MSIQYKDKDGTPHDEKIHGEILSAVNFNRTPAYAQSIARFMALGLTEKEAKELMRCEAA
jgi:hypothetical protein